MKRRLALAGTESSTQLAVSSPSMSACFAEVCSMRWRKASGDTKCILHTGCGGQLFATNAPPTPQAPKHPGWTEDCSLTMALASTMALAVRWGHWCAPQSLGCTFHPTRPSACRRRLRGAQLPVVPRVHDGDLVKKGNKPWPKMTSVPFRGLSDLWMSPEQ